MAWPECTPPNPFLNIRLPRMGFWERPSTSTPTAPLYAMTLASPGWIPPTVWPPVLTRMPMIRLPRILVAVLSVPMKLPSSVATGASRMIP